MEKYLSDISVVFPEECKGVVIESLNFSNRLSNCIHRAGIFTLEELLNTEITKLESVPGFGAGSKKELIEKLSSDSLREYIDLLNNSQSDAGIRFIHSLFSMQINKFNDLPIEELNVSKKAKRILQRYGINKVCNILQMPVERMQSISGLGVKGYNEVVESLRVLESGNETDSFRFKYSRKLENLTIEEILAINLTPYNDVKIEALNLSFRTFERLKRKNIDTVGALMHQQLCELFSISGFGNTSYNDVMNKLIRFSEQVGIGSGEIEFKKKGRTTQVEIVLSRLKPETLEREASDYIQAYRMVDSKFRVILNNRDLTLYELIRQRSSSEKYSQFLNWLISNENLISVYSRHMEEVLSDSRSRIILDLRDSGRTLNEVAQRFQITRERVRQIEKKLCRELLSGIDFAQLNARIYLDTLDNTAVFRTDFDNAFPEYSKYLIYSIRLLKPSPYKYLKELDGFTISQKDIDMNKVLSKIPEFFQIIEYGLYFRKIMQLTNLSPRAVERILEVKYTIVGKCYTRGELTNTKMYDFILKKYYGNGIHVYDSEQLEQFRVYLEQEFSLETIPDNDRALIAGIIRIGILCGRGVYRAKENKRYISPNLEKRIARYIEKNKYLLVNAIYLKYKNELAQYGIDNRYYLHGVLKEIFGKKYFFKKDYISTSKRFSSIYDAILLYIKKSKAPVTKEEIKNRFPGVTEIMIQLAISDQNIINLFGKYIDANNLELRPNDIEYFESIIETMLCSKDVIKAKDIYDYIETDNATLLNRLGAFHSYSLFSILQYIFEDKYQFMRPWIARFGTVIHKPLDQVRDYLSVNDIGLVHEMLNIANEANYRFSGVQRFIDTFNNTHLMISKYEVKRIDLLGVSENDVREFENIIDVSETMRIDEMMDQLGSVIENMPVNEWSIYSLIKKWGVKYECAMANNYSHAIPLIAPAGHMDLSDITKFERKIYQPEDDDDIDDLIADLIIEELEDEL